MSDNVAEIYIPPSTKAKFPFMLAIAVLIAGIGIGFAVGRVTAPAQPAMTNVPAPASTNGPTSP